MQLLTLKFLLLSQDEVNELIKEHNKDKAKKTPSK